MYDGEIVFEVMSSNAQEANTAEASLNGHCVPVRRGVDPGDIHARQYLYSTIRILGFSCTDSVFNQEAPSLTQPVTIGVSGLVTSFNTGIDVIHSGQAIRAIPPLRGQDQAPKRGAKPGSGSRRVMSTTNVVKAVDLDHPDDYLFWYSALDQLSGYVGTSQSRGLVREQMDILATPPMRPYWKECHVERGAKKGVSTSVKRTPAASVDVMESSYDEDEEPAATRVNSSTALGVATPSPAQLSRGNKKVQLPNVTEFNEWVSKNASYHTLFTRYINARWDYFKADFNQVIDIVDICVQLNAKGVFIETVITDEALKELSLDKVVYERLSEAKKEAFEVKQRFDYLSNEIFLYQRKVEDAATTMSSIPNSSLDEYTTSLSAEFYVLTVLLEDIEQEIRDGNTAIKFDTLAKQVMKGLTTVRAAEVKAAAMPVLQNFNKLTTSPGEEEEEERDVEEE